MNASKFDLLSLLKERLTKFSNRTPISAECRLALTIIKRKFWKKEETLLFLTCCSGRKDEFDHPRKKKFAFQNVLDDMIFQGFSDTSVTAKSLEVRFRSLLSSYKVAKDTSRRTGAAAAVISYWEQLEEMFGAKPTISNSHASSFGDLLTNNKSPKNTTTTVITPITINEVNVTPNENMTEENLKVVECTSSCASTATSTREINLTSTSPASPLNLEKPRRRKTAKEKFYKQKLELSKKKKKYSARNIFKRA